VRVAVSEQESRHVVENCGVEKWGNRYHVYAEAKLLAESELQKLRMKTVIISSPRAAGTREKSAARMRKNTHYIIEHRYSHVSK